MNTTIINELIALYTHDDLVDMVNWYGAHHLAMQVHAAKLLTVDCSVENINYAILDFMNPEWVFPEQVSSAPWKVAHNDYSWNVYEEFQGVA